jgi:phosphoribosylaminoimidazole-succinocarboxamide synthase
MSLARLVIRNTDDFPLRHAGAVHNGKVRSVYWLSREDSRRMVEKRGYAVPDDTPLGVMVI